MLFSHIRPVIVALAVAACAVSGWSQTQPSRTTRPPVEIRKLEGRGSRTRVRTPYFDTNQDRGTSPVREWYRLNLYYDTEPEWIDELTIKFHVMALERTQNGPAYSLYRKTVRFGDIRRGRNHRASVYLRPQPLERYGEVVAAAVEVVLQAPDGRQVTLTESDEGVELPERWWNNPAVTESRAVTIRDGYLLDRKQSPWALINIDDYEVIK
jgi:hypothetical protein